MVNKWERRIKRQCLIEQLLLIPIVVFDRVMNNLPLKELVYAALFEYSFRDRMPSMHVRRVSLNIHILVGKCRIHLEDSIGDSFDIVLKKADSAGYEYRGKGVYHGVHAKNDNAYTFITEHPLIDVGPLVRYLENVFQTQLNRVVISKAYMIKMLHMDKETLRYPLLLPCREILLCDYEVFLRNRISKEKLDFFVKNISEICKKIIFNYQWRSPTDYFPPPGSCGEFLKIKYNMTFTDFENLRSKRVTIVGRFNGDGYNLLIKRWLRGDYDELQHLMFWAEMCRLPPSDYADFVEQVQVGLCCSPYSEENDETESNKKLSFTQPKDSYSFQVTRADGRIAICTFLSGQGYWSFRILAVPDGNGVVCDIETPFWSYFEHRVDSPWSSLSSVRIPDPRCNRRRRKHRKNKKRVSWNKKNRNKKGHP